eukprot:scaffold100938_cov35-Phaeocystis_antarctica.AAC.1
MEDTASVAWPFKGDPAASANPHPNPDADPNPDPNPEPNPSPHLSKVTPRQRRPWRRSGLRLARCRP